MLLPLQLTPARVTNGWTEHEYRYTYVPGYSRCLHTELLLLRPQLYEHAIPSPYNCNFLPRYPSRSFFIEPSTFPKLIFKKNSCGRMSATNTERPISLSPRLLTLPLLRFNHPLVPLGSNQLLSVCVCVSVCACVCKGKREYLTPNINEMVSRLCA